MSELYRSISNDSLAHGERNDCVVRALTAVSGLPYSQVHEVCRLAGRRRRAGMYVADWEPLIEQLAGKVTNKIDMPKQRNGSSYTMKTVLNALPMKGRFLVLVRGHLAAVVDGQIIDWSAGRKHRVRRIYEIDGTGTLQAEPNAPRNVIAPRKPAQPRRKGACAEIWEFCDNEYSLGLSMKQIRKALIDKGFNRNTVNRQTNEWKKARGFA